MATLNISLPEPMRDFVLEQVEAGSFSSASEYIRDLVRAAQKAAARARLEQLLQEGIDSGMEPLTDDDWQDLRRRLEDRTGRETA